MRHLAGPKHVLRHSQASFRARVVSMKEGRTFTTQMPDAGFFFYFINMMTPSVIIVGVPLGIVALFYNVNSAFVFLINFFAIIPLATILSFIVDEFVLQMSRFLGEILSRARQGMLMHGLWPTSDRLELSAAGRINNISVSALADSGSSLDIVSVDFIRRYNLRLDSTKRIAVRLPNKVIYSLGSITLPFAFHGESDVFHRNFHVMSCCTHDFILGHPFLKASETLSKYKSRLQVKLTPRPCGPRLRLIGSPKQRILGSINGRPVTAVPDTGSDVMLMSRRQAQKLGLHVQTSSKFRTWLEFADGSRSLTYGVVHNVNWRFGGANPKSKQYDFYVMKRLPCDIILSNDFIHKSKAFSRYSHLITNHHVRSTTAKVNTDQELNLVRELASREKKSSHWMRWLLKHLKFSSSRPSPSSQHPHLTGYSNIRQELQRREDAEARIGGLPLQEQQAAWETELSDRELWDRNNQFATHLNSSAASRTSLQAPSSLVGGSTA